ncbi:TBC1 domain family member 2 [Nematocida sp. AWRm77]|nr:TBC1 domain family member 2 [Nematocida sp. AWRm77]
MDMRELKERAWFGLGSGERAVGWLVLLDVLSPSVDQHAQSIEQRKRAYSLLVQSPGSPVLSPDIGSPSFTPQAKMLRQIEKDVRRVGITHAEREVYTRAMCAFSKQHPVIGYVQGMCEIFRVFYDVFSSEFDLEASEALSYFCFVKVVGRALDHFSSGQQGIERVIEEIDELLRKHAQDLHAYFSSIGLETKYFAYNWSSTFLFREFSAHKAVMDAHFSLGVCEFTRFNTSFAISVVLFFKDKLAKKPFEEALLLLQNIGAYPWTKEGLSQVLAIAYVVYSGGSLNIKRK